MTIGEFNRPKVMVFHNGVYKPNAKEVVGTAVTVGTPGVATFYFTDDGTANGAPLLTTVYSAHAATVSADASAVNVPDAVLREINVEGKYVSARARVFTGVQVLSINVLGSISFVGAGTTIYFKVIGE